MHRWSCPHFHILQGKCGGIASFTLESYLFDSVVFQDSIVCNTEKTDPDVTLKQKTDEHDIIPTTVRNFKRETVKTTTDK